MSRYEDYGNKLPTSWEILLKDKKWRRVYVIQWSNAGSAYILKGKQRLFLGSFEPSDFHSDWYQKRRTKEFVSDEFKRSGSPSMSRNSSSYSPAWAGQRPSPS